MTKDKYIEEVLEKFKKRFAYISMGEKGCSMNKKSECYFVVGSDMHENLKDFISSSLSSYTTTLLSELATKKRWVRTFRDENTGEPKDEYVVRDKDIQEFIKIIKSNE